MYFSPKLRDSKEGHVFCWPPFWFLPHPRLRFAMLRSAIFGTGQTVRELEERGVEGTKKLDLPRFGATSTPKDFDTP